MNRNERARWQQGRSNYKNITINGGAKEGFETWVVKALLERRKETGGRKYNERNLTYCMDGLSFSVGFCFCSAAALCGKGPQVAEPESILISQSMEPRKFGAQCISFAAPWCRLAWAVDAGAQGRQTVRDSFFRSAGKAETS